MNMKGLTTVVLMTMPSLILVACSDDSSPVEKSQESQLDVGAADDMRVAGANDLGVGAPVMTGPDTGGNTSDLSDTGASDTEADAASMMMGDTPDSDAQDMDVPDSAVVDMGMIDPGRTDARSPDVGEIDPEVEDAAIPDARAPDAGDMNPEIDDAAIPDGRAPDVGVLEPVPADAAIADAGRQDQNAADQGLPGPGDLDSAVPDLGVPDPGHLDAGGMDAGDPQIERVDLGMDDPVEADIGVVDAGGDPRRPATPTACSDLNRGECECIDAEGFTTWTWWVAEQQRCATTYVPPRVQGPLPVVISNDCYTGNRLGLCQPGSNMVDAADRFGFVGVCTTAADGNWTFGNDGVVNDRRPTPCAAEDSKDITYLDGVFSIIDRLGASGSARADEIFAWGFSQNAMFTAWTAFCYPDRITAFWQGGSGLYVAGRTNPLPQMEGACRASDFIEFGRACVREAPCDECQYFPVYPVRSQSPLNGCIMAYTDDFLFETAAPMAEAMTAEGHSAKLLQFPDIGRGHSNPLIEWDWLVGCMEVVDACSPACAQAVTECVGDRRGNTAQARAGHYSDCLTAMRAQCDAGCAPTLEMLRLVERPCLVDGVCDNGETPETCATDCGGDMGGGDVGGGPPQLASCEELRRPFACCGDDVCDGPENPDNCIVDCAGQQGGGAQEQLASCEELRRPFACCGDNVCDGPENPDNCIVDCR